MWIIHEPKKVALWNKRHFEEKNGECAACLKYSVLIFVEKNYIKCNIWRVAVRPSYIWDARLLKVNPFSPISPLIPSTQVSFGLPRFLLPGGRHFITSFGNLPSSILWTCPHNWSCLILISSKRHVVTFIFCLITLFLILSFLEIRAERRHNSISVEFSFATVFFFLFLNTLFLLHM